MIVSKWLNPWGLVKPRADLTDGGGNDPLYTALYLQRYRNARGHIPNYWVSGFLRHVVPRYQLQPGLFVRRPPPDILHQENWDNVLAWIAISGLLKEPKIARDILWYGITHLGFFNTDGKLKREDWLWRYLHLWAIAVPTAFPCLESIYKPYIRFLSRFMNADHPGGILLDWLWLNRARYLGVDTIVRLRREGQFDRAALDQMDPDHPIHSF